MEEEPQFYRSNTWGQGGVHIMWGFTMDPVRNEHNERGWVLTHLTEDHTWRDLPAWWSVIANEVIDEFF